MWWRENARVCRASVGAGVAFVLILMLSAAACAKHQKVVVGDLTLGYDDVFDEYYLAGPGGSVAPVQRLGWSGGIVVVEIERWGWRYLDTRTKDGWHIVLSEDEALRLVNASPARGMRLLPVEEAWDRLPAPTS